MATSSALPAYRDAANRAKAAFQNLPHGNDLFQQCVLNKITIEAVFEEIRRNSLGHKRKLSTVALDRFHHCTAWMLNISKPIDVAVNASAGIACPVWAPIKFVLLVSQDNATATESIISVIQSIADNLPRLDLYQRFQGDESFQVALVNLFADITEFASLAHQFFRKRTASE